MCLLFLIIYYFLVRQLIVQSIIGIYTWDTSKRIEDTRGSPDNPLDLASKFLYVALTMSSGKSSDTDGITLLRQIKDDNAIPTPKKGSVNVDVECYEMALVSLAYVKLQLNDHAEARKICKLVGLGSTIMGVGTNPSVASRRMKELAEMYSHQASVHAG